MSESLVVYTVIIGKYDTLKPPLAIDPNVRHVCITDGPLPNVPPWTQRVVRGNHGPARRHSRLYKTMSHACFPLAEYSLYVDGRIQLKIHPEEALGWLKNHDMALCQHPTDDCAYAEAQKVKDWLLDDFVVVSRQMARYREEGYPKKNGLAAGTVILRRHTRMVQKFNNYWWIEVGNNSSRDQLSLNYCLWLLGMGHDVIPGHLFRNPNFVYHEGHNGYRL